jgi:hypothetical protein
MKTRACGAAKEDKLIIISYNKSKTPKYKSLLIVD